MSLEQNFISISRQIAESYNPLQSVVRLLAVSKTKPVTMIESLWHFGQRDFGENYVQEALEKIKALKHLKHIQWHMIGSLQSNKTKEVAIHFDWVQTVNRLKIAQRLNDQRPESLPALNVCIQVNISQQAEKSGISAGEVSMLAKQITALPRLKLRGLMTVPATLIQGDLVDRQRLNTEFKQMFTLYKELQQAFPEEKIDTLSMGMSRDLNLAIEQGSTMVRIGSALFGAR